MKCENCGANTVNDVCEYCGYQPEVKDDKEVNVYINNTYNQNSYNQDSYNQDSYNQDSYNDNGGYVHTANTKSKNGCLQVFLWVFFWYVMVFVVIIKSDKLSKNAKIILCSAIGLIFIIMGVSGSSSSYEVEPEKTYSVGEEAFSGDFEILVTGFIVDEGKEYKVLVIDYDLKYVGSYPDKISTVLYLDYKLNDADGLLYEKDLIYKVEKLPSYLEEGDKGKGQIAYKLEHNVENDLIFSILSGNYSVDCDVKYVLPKEEIEKKLS